METIEKNSPQLRSLLPMKIFYQLRCSEEPWMFEGINEYLNFHIKLEAGKIFGLKRIGREEQTKSLCLDLGSKNLM